MICIYVCRNCNHSKLDVELSNTFGFQKGLLLTVHILSTQGWLHIYYYILLWQLLTKWFIIHQKLFCIVIRDASPNFPRTFLVVHFWIKAFFISILHHIAIFVCSTGSTVTPWWISGTDGHLDRSRWLGAWSEAKLPAASIKSTGARGIASRDEWPSELRVGSIQESDQSRDQAL